jgi:hypothetical protein
MSSKRAGPTVMATPEIDDPDISPRLRRELEKRMASLDQGKGLTTEQVRERFERRRAAKLAARRR